MNPVPVSVCMATRNGERFLPRQLESILRQLAKDDEIIVSDDSSTDRTPEIVASCRDPRVKFFPGNAFFHPAYNLENALKRSTGEIIVLADQDDVWLENKVDLVRERLKGRSGQIVTLSLDGEVIDAEGVVVCASIFGMIGAGRGLVKNLYDNTYMGCTMAFTRRLLDVALPFPKTIPMHDSWLGLLSEIYGEVEFVPEKTMQYRRHEDNASFRRPFREQVGSRLALAGNLLRRRLLVGTLPCNRN
ncbi:MAG: alpha-L-Rha alpha-1,3-L-rhamnosyltransferase [Desulfuromonas sp.]|nr:MAG: alpha-L-Rha alpha-1,3-L-rhamnosyltransferase [Desulfuromonas sp.]